ncbi:hypothetical protein F5877DRAFT_84862 [Lentinula edodes]|nr:hypothetical protein F5877DRAFT_84862 [Lentinula edodes]
MSASRTTTTTTSTSLTAGPSRSRPIPLPPPVDPSVDEEEGLENKDEDDIIRRAQARVERVRARKAAEAARKAAEEQAAAAAREKAAQEVPEQALWAQQREEEVTERRRLMVAAVTARSQRGTSPSEASTSPRRLIVEIQKTKKGKKIIKAQPVGRDSDDGDDGDDDDDNEEDRAPCERCQNKKLPCQMQAGKRSSIICKPYHDTKVRCSYSGRPTALKQREGGSGERIAVMESQMAQGLADLQAIRETHSHSQQYLHQLLRTQEDDHAWLIAIETRMAMMGGTDDEESEEEEEEKGVEEKEKKVEKDGEGEEVEMEEEETVPTEARSEKGNERAE